MTEMNFQYTGNGEIVEKSLEICRGPPTRIVFIYPVNTPLSADWSADVRLEYIIDPEQKPKLGEGWTALVYDVFLNGKTGEVWLSEKAADGSGEQPRLHLTINEKELSPSTETKEDKVKATKDRNTKLAMRIVDKVHRMTDITVKDPVENKINAENRVVLGTAARIITDIWKLHPEVSLEHLYGTENLIYLLPEGAGPSQKALRKWLRRFYSLVYVAATETDKTLGGLSKSDLAMIRRACHETYLKEAKKIKGADARDKRADEKKANHDAWLDSLTDVERAEYHEAEAKKKTDMAAAAKQRAAARNALKRAEEEKAAKEHTDEVVAGYGTFSNLMANNINPFKLVGGSYEILINEGELHALRALFKEAVSKPLHVGEMVSGFAKLDTTMKHMKTISYLKSVLINKCTTMANQACKNPGESPNEFFKDWLKYILVRLVGVNSNDTCHTENPNALRVPAVSNKHLEEFMEKSQEAYDTWAKDMKDPEKMLAQLDKLGLHADMQDIFDKVSEYMVPPVMTEEIVETWNKNKKMFQATVVMQTLVRSYRAKKDKGKRLSGTVEYCLGNIPGVLDKEESEIERLKKKVKRIETTFNNATKAGVTKAADQTNIDNIKQKLDKAKGEHAAAAKDYAKIMRMGLKEFVDATKGEASKGE